MNCKNKKGHINSEYIHKESKSTKYNSICLLKCHHSNFFRRCKFILMRHMVPRKWTSQITRELTYLCRGMINLLGFCPSCTALGRMKNLSPCIIYMQLLSAPHCYERLWISLFELFTLRLYEASLFTSANLLPCECEICMLPEVGVT